MPHNDEPQKNEQQETPSSFDDTYYWQDKWEKTRVYLLVEPDKIEREYKTNSGQIVLSPPPLDLSYGVAYSFGKEGDPEDSFRAWVLQKGEESSKPLPLYAMMYITANYCDACREAVGIVCILLHITLSAILLRCIAYVFPDIAFLAYLAPLMIAMILAVCFFSLKKNPPHYLCNRLRQEIYLYERKTRQLIIIPFATARFVLMAQRNVYAGLSVETPPLLQKLARMETSVAFPEG